jgi:hypothetical protein
VKLHWISEVKADKKRRASVYIKCLMGTEKFTDNTKHKEHQQKWAVGVVPTYGKQTYGQQYDYNTTTHNTFVFLYSSLGPTCSSDVCLCVHIYNLPGLLSIWNEMCKR